MSFYTHSVYCFYRFVKMSRPLDIIADLCIIKIDKLRSSACQSAGFGSLCKTLSRKRGTRADMRGSVFICYVSVTARGGNRAAASVAPENASLLMPRGSTNNGHESVKR